MRRLIPLILLLALTSAIPADRFTTLSERAARSFEWHEWNSAAAQYVQLLEMRADSARLYSRAIVAYELSGDTVAGSVLVERAMAHGIGFASLIADVRATSFSVGAGDTYAAFLLRMQREMPWMARAIDHQLLDYYTFRRDGAMMVKYSQMMLDGLPSSVEYLSLLAEGYLLDGQGDLAVNTWKKIIGISPDDYSALLNLGIYCRLHGDSATAAECLRRAYEVHPTPYVEVLLSQL
ncbi:MAG: hypothetical protein K2M00_01280 [Muribaculaceae bacterium]|nr:hypothetical protein [Muribaculaceae bacterium]